MAGGWGQLRHTGRKGVRMGTNGGGMGAAETHWQERGEDGNQWQQDRVGDASR